MSVNRTLQCEDLPPHGLSLRTLQAAKKIMQRLIVGILVVCLPLQAVSATVTAMLGARHSHQMPVTQRTAATEPTDPMSGWRDLRRMQYGDAHIPSHERVHALGLRHHHYLGDSSVIQEDASELADGGLSTDTVQASASILFMAGSSAVDVPPPSETPGEAWDIPGSVAPGAPDPRRIERPPQALSA
jgi:hypothetical protein